MDDLVADIWACAERLYDRLGTKSARGLDVDACVLLSRAADEIERLSSPAQDTKA